MDTRQRPDYRVSKLADGGGKIESQSQQWQNYCCDGDIIYAGVYRRRDSVRCLHWEPGAKASTTNPTASKAAQVTDQIIKSNDSRLRPNTTLTINASKPDGLSIHLLLTNGTIFAIAATTECPRESAMGFLKNIYKRYVDHVEEDQLQGANLDEPSDVQPISEEWYSQMCQEIYTGGQEDKIAVIAEQVSEVEGLMASNIQVVVDRQESFRQIMEKGETIKQVSRQFQNESDDVERIIRFRNLKVKVILGCCVSIIIVYIAIPAAQMIG